MKPLVPSRIAELLFATVLGYVGISWHIMNAHGMSGLIPDYMPGDPKTWVYISGIGFVLTALAIITGIMKTLGCYLLAAMILVFAFTKHLQPAIDGNTFQLVNDLVFAIAAILIGNRGTKN